MTSDLSALIARLEAAEAGNRELGRDVLIELSVVREVESTLFYGVGNEDTWHFGDDAESEGYWRILPDPTTSLDAALALAERALPEHMRGPITLCIAGSAEAYVDHVDPCGDSVKAFGKTPALALCICILEAIQHRYEAAGEVSPNLKAKAQGEG